MSFQSPSMEELIFDSQIVARVRIKSFESVFFQFGEYGHEFSCGIRYTAEVIESLKGEKGTVEFVTSNSQMLEDLFQDFLVFVRPPQLELLDSLGGSTLPGFKQEELKCQLRPGPYISSSEWVEFDFRSSIKYGGEWVNVGQSPGLFNTRFEYRELRREGNIGVRTVVSWPDLRNAILDKIHAAGE